MLFSRHSREIKTARSELSPKDAFRASLSSFSSLDRKMSDDDANHRIYLALKNEFLHLVKHRTQYRTHWLASEEFVLILIKRFVVKIDSMEMKPRQRKNLHEKTKQFRMLFERATQQALQANQGDRRMDFLLPDTELCQ